MKAGSVWTMHHAGCKYVYCVFSFSKLQKQMYYLPFAKIWATLAGPICRPEEFCHVNCNGEINKRGWR